jgi:hypothetical protein
MVAAGEAGGVLDVILERLADFLEKAERLKRKIVGAMIYPSVVICSSRRDCDVYHGAGRAEVQGRSLPTSTRRCRR